MLPHRRSAASTKRTRSDLNLPSHQFSVLFCVCEFTFDIQSISQYVLLFEGIACSCHQGCVLGTIIDRQSTVYHRGTSCLAKMFLGDMLRFQI